MKKTCFNNHKLKRFSPPIRHASRSITQPARLVIFNKPYGVLPQFTDQAGRQTLKDYIPIPGIYAAGRLDRDSEGLLILTNNGALQAQITQPDKRCAKVYYIQVEGEPDETALHALRSGITLNDGPTLPALVSRVDEPNWLWPRLPAVRRRLSIPDCWLSVTLYEGRNRQLRRMTAHVGFPTLRLIRFAIGSLTLDNLPLGTWRELPPDTLL